MKNELMSQVAMSYKGEYTKEDLIKHYNKGCKDEVIATIYSHSYSLFYSTTLKYLGLSDLERESIITEQIWKCLSDYDASKSKGKLETMICTYIRNACRSVTQQNNYDKRKVSQSDVTTLFSAYEDGTDKLESFAIDAEYETVEMLMYLEQKKPELSEGQYKIVKAILDSNAELSKADIARETGVSKSGVKLNLDYLKNKLADLIA